MLRIIGSFCTLRRNAGEDLPLPYDCPVDLPPCDSRKLPEIEKAPSRHPRARQTATLGIFSTGLRQRYCNCCPRWLACIPGPRIFRDFLSSLFLSSFSLQVLLRSRPLDPRRGKEKPCFWYGEIALAETKGSNLVRSDPLTS